MKVLFLSLLAACLSHTAAADDLKWSGTAGTRYAEKQYQDGIDDFDTNGRNRNKEKNTKFNIKAKLGVTGTKENFDWGFALRTLSAGNAASGAGFSEWVSYNASGSDLAVSIDQAFTRYNASCDTGSYNATLGRHKGIFTYDTVVQNLFSSDMRFDGLSAQSKMGNFSVNAGQYLLGAQTSAIVGASTTTSLGSTSATNPSGDHSARMNWLTGIQPTFQWKLSDEISGLVGVGHYIFHTDGYVNTAHGIGASGTTAGTSIGQMGTALPGSQSFTVGVDNSRIWQLLARVELPMNLQVSAEWLRNKKIFYPASFRTKTLDRDAIQVGISWGKLKKARDFTIGYNYLDKGLGSTYSLFSNSTIQADAKGHHVHAGYNITDFFTVGAKVLVVKEKSVRENTGAVMGSSTGTSAYSRYLAKYNYWELTTAMNF